LTGMAYPGADMTYDVFCEKVAALTSVQLACYKQRQMERRILSLINRERARGYGDFYRRMKEDPGVVKRFLDYLPINVSEFFRNPEKFHYLEFKVLPALLKRKRPLRVWSAACSNGSEPYSLAILLHEAGARDSAILATDIDQDALAEAQLGQYSTSLLKNVSPERLRRYFRAQGDQYSITPEVRSYVRFKRHDLLNDSYEGNWDLILCRNVMIYFKEEAKDRVLAGLAQALAPQGVLFLGCTETISNPARMGLESLSAFFYEKRVGGSSGTASEIPRKRCGVV